jgi:hypothetical protein
VPKEEESLNFDHRQVVRKQEGQVQLGQFAKRTRVE